MKYKSVEEEICQKAVERVYLPTSVGHFAACLGISKTVAKQALREFRGALVERREDRAMAGLTSHQFAAVLVPMWCMIHLNLPAQLARELHGELGQMVAQAVFAKQRCVVGVCIPVAGNAALNAGVASGKMEISTDGLRDAYVIDLTHLARHLDASDSGIYPVTDAILRE